MAKIKINVQGEEVEITLTPEQLAEIEAQKKPKKFEFSYEQGKTFYLSDRDIINSSWIGKDLISIEHGRYRLTKEAAEQSIARNKRANRLEALAEQLGGLRVKKEGTRAWYVSYYKGSWVPSDDSDSLYDVYRPEVVYMSYECAIEICRMLDEGEFSLDGEL